MKRRAAVRRLAASAALSAACAALLAGCATCVPYDQVTVWRTDPARGTFPAYLLRAHGNFGAGALPGGAAGVVFDGLRYYRASGGRLSNSSSAGRLSSGWAVRFRADRMDAVPEGFDDAALARRVGEAVPGASMACAFRVAGYFSAVSVASPGGGAAVPLGPAAGSVYGYRAAGCADASSATELWFVSADRGLGGRVVSFRVSRGSLAVDLCPRYLTIHPGLRAATRDLRR